MNIKIGDNNNISKSKIGHQNNGGDKEPNNKKGIIISLIIAFVVGFIFIFPFWTSVAERIESFLK